MAVNTLALYLFVNYSRSLYNCQCSGFLAAIKMSSGCTYLEGYVIRQRLYVVLVVDLRPSPGGLDLFLSQPVYACFPGNFVSSAGSIISEITETYEA